LPGGYCRPGRFQLLQQRGQHPDLLRLPVRHEQAEPVQAFVGQSVQLPGAGRQSSPGKCNSKWRRQAAEKLRPIQAKGTSCLDEGHLLRASERPRLALMGRACSATRAAFPRFQAIGWRRSSPSGAPSAEDTQVLRAQLESGAGPAIRRALVAWSRCAATAAKRVTMA
jgi:hypothetical protein